MRYKFTTNEVNKILKELIITTDSREQKNAHILKWFDDNKIKHEEVKNDFGDYSAYIKKGTIKGIDRDLYFDKIISIERKANIDELANNLKKENKPRLKSEFAHLNKYNVECHLFMEDLLFKKHMREEKYRSLWKGKTLNATIHGFRSEYKIHWQNIDKDDMGSEIYSTIYYSVRNYLLREFNIVD